MVSVRACARHSSQFESSSPAKFARQIAREIPLLARVHWSFLGQLSPAAPNEAADLNVQIADVERVLFDELPPWLDLIAHEHAEQLVGPNRIAHLHLQQ
jgi:hypothetical protein